MDGGRHEQPNPNPNPNPSPNPNPNLHPNPNQVADTGSLRFPSAQMIRDDAGTYGDVARSFDWWMSRICMPDDLTLTPTLSLTLQ